MNYIEYAQSKMGFKGSELVDKYSKAGACYKIDNNNLNGYYWFYETENFIIDIHDFIFKKDTLLDIDSNFETFISLISTYNIISNGEYIDLKQEISSNTMFIMSTKNIRRIRYFMHGNYPYKAVGIKFKDKMLDEFFVDKLHFDKTKIPELFVECKNSIVSQISKIAKEILSCNMVAPAANIFFEAKASEWISVFLNAYIENQDEKNFLAKDDDLSIELVAEYINKHYSFNIHQDILEKIAMMSGTQLKTKFKKKYKMTITEYTQRKRVDVAEHLLLSTNMDIKNIAKSVGYNSASRFSTLFKRYKGFSPKDIKSYISK